MPYLGALCLEKTRDDASTGSSLSDASRSLEFCHLEACHYGTLQAVKDHGAAVAASRPSLNVKFHRILGCQWLESMHADVINGKSRSPVKRRMKWKVSLLNSG